MSRATSDDQLRFLLSCVNHSTNGRVDFAEVARECGVVSKGAAAKRYERLLKANGINSVKAPHAATTVMTSAVSQKPIKKTKETGAKKRKLETHEKLAEGEEKKLKPSANATQEAAGSNEMKSESANGVSQPAMVGGMPLAPGFPSMYMARPPQMAHGLPPYAMQQQPGFTGYLSYGQQLPQDIPMHPPFAPINFREPWTTPVAYQDDGFQEYIGQDAYHQHLQLEPLPTRVPPPPQEVVFMKPEERHVEEGEEPSRVGEVVVVVE